MQNVSCWREKLGFKILYRIIQRMLKKANVYSVCVCVCVCVCVLGEQGWMDSQRLCSVKCLEGSYAKIIFVDFYFIFKKQSLILYKLIKSIKCIKIKLKFIDCILVHVWLTLHSCVVLGGENVRIRDFSVHICLWVCKERPHSFVLFAPYFIF